jgi:DNA mismatch repair protein MutS
MQNDKTTLKDLSIFTTETSGGVFALLDHTTTQAGKDSLRRHILHPPDSYEALQAMQDAVKFWAGNLNKWPEVISNGTLIMLEKFFDAADNVSATPGGMTSIFGNVLQKWFNKNEYFFTQFSLSHLSDFLKGCKQLTEILKQDDVPALLQQQLQQIDKELQHRLTDDIIAVHKETPFRELAALSYKARREVKLMVLQLTSIYAKMDAIRSLAAATVLHKWSYPVLLPERPVRFEATQLYHPLLQEPVPYDINFDGRINFLVLTGANMSGKTTFMRAMGVAALLAHLGAGVPASSMRVSFLQGIITNMHVEDDLMKGQSYFFAEVQRMKQTAEKLIKEGAHLVLMDELFKGTNVHDAYECTRAVIDGLVQREGHLMILSTHLYEVAQHFKENPSIQFAYFVTQATEDGNFKFRYELKNGISNDRIGYKILEREGVIALLNRKPGK